MSNAKTQHATSHKSGNHPVEEAAKGETNANALSTAAQTQPPADNDHVADGASKFPDPAAPKKPLTVEDRLTRLEDLFRAMGHQLD